MGMGLVIASQIAAGLFGLVRGGFKVGRLEKTVGLFLSKDRLPSFLDTANGR